MPGRSATTCSASSGPLICGITTSVSSRSMGPSCLLAMSRTSEVRPVTKTLLPLLQQHLPNQFPHLLIILGQQDRLVSGVGNRGPFRTDRRFAGLISGGPIDLKRRAESEFTVEGNLAAVLLDNAVDHTQTQPGTLPNGFRREKGLEH